MSIFAHLSCAVRKCAVGAAGSKYRENSLFGPSRTLPSFLGPEKYFLPSLTQNVELVPYLALPSVPLGAVLKTLFHGLVYPSIQ